ncbi:MAG: Wzz/FepE/Etk N-terminal domain-containing protein [Erythrobacter sp.]|uniref:XrtA system polysaccharide chain length determinant n=1 Tax=Erythrobacter sp. TaxID=1042 RepID=UPI002613EE31|nr:XrtA system polysaccharide chain length determinant [Erythrobacter sp.]MDJ0977855.1 Wzz/FepE/Etk N-terminal domain-containing protein [Erythrobacter sp.]
MDELYDEVRTALYTVWHRRWIALGVAWVVCLLGWVAVALIPNSYTSRARIYVDVEDVLSEQLGIAGDGREEIKKVRQTLASNTNLERVLTGTRLGEGIDGRGAMTKAIESLSEKVSVLSEEDNLFEISATVGRGDLSDAENALLARNVVQKLLDIFREDHVAGSRVGVNRALAKIDEQLAERKRELEDAEARRLQFEAKYPDLIGGSATLSTKIQQLRTEMRDIDADMAGAQASLASLDSQIANTPRTIIGPDGLGGPKAALVQAQQQLSALKARGLTDQHPDVEAAIKRVVALRQQAENAGPEDEIGTPNQVYSSLVAIRSEREANIQSLEARRAGIQSQIANLTASQASEPAIAAEANRISRDYDVLRQNYEKLLQDREDIRTRGEVDDQTSQFKFDLIDPPVVPQEPAAPNRPLLLVGVLIVGLGAGAGSAWALGQMRSTFMTAQKLERTFDLPVIGTVSQTVSDTARALAKRRLIQFSGATAALVGVCVLLLVIEIVSIRSVA